MDTARINELKDQICDVCHKMWQLGWVAANDGNVSARLDDGTFLCTPTGMSKSFITPEKLLRVDKDLKVLEGQEGLRPSSEMKMHLRCYEKRPDVMCVVHAHPPGATGFAVAHKAMDMYNMIEDVTVIGSVPLTPYGTPSTTEVQMQCIHEGLVFDFLKAGIVFTNPTCALCTAEHYGALPSGDVGVATNNRNFIGKVGKGSHTYLLSPMSAMATAVNGQITDPRDYLN